MRGSWKLPETLAFVRCVGIPSVYTMFALTSYANIGIDHTCCHQTMVAKLEGVPVTIHLFDEQSTSMLFVSNIAFGFKCVMFVQSEAIIQA